MEPFALKIDRAGEREINQVLKNLPEGINLSSGRSLLFLHLPQSIEARDVERVKELFASALYTAHGFSRKSGPYGIKEIKQLFKKLAEQAGVPKQALLYKSEIHAIKRTLAVIDEGQGKKILYPFPWHPALLEKIAHLAQQNLRTDNRYQEIVEKYRK